MASLLLLALRADPAQRMRLQRQMSLLGLECQAERANTGRIMDVNDMSNGQRTNQSSLKKLDDHAIT